MDILFYLEVEDYDNSCSDPDCCGGPYESYSEVFVMADHRTTRDEETFRKILGHSWNPNIPVIREATQEEDTAYYTGYQKGFSLGHDAGYNLGLAEGPQ
jgi:hypothetical protein